MPESLTPTTATGVSEFVVVLLPNRPKELSPQQSTPPVAFVAQVELLLVLTEVAVTAPATPGDSATAKIGRTLMTSPAANAVRRYDRRVVTRIRHFLTDSSQLEQIQGARSPTLLIKRLRSESVAKTPCCSLSPPPTTSRREEASDCCRH